MDILLIIIFFILLLILMIVITYIIYDYINYKDNVNKSIKLSTNKINDNFDKISKNINIESDITNDKFTYIESEIDSLDFNNGTNKINIDMLNNTITSNAIFDEAIFKIDPGIMTSSYHIEPNINLFKQVNSFSGMYHYTNDSTALNICDGENSQSLSCIEMNIDSNNFNIKSNDIYNFNINNNDDNIMAKFDLLYNNIYLGGNDLNNSSVAVINSGADQHIYMNNLSVLKTELDGSKNINTPLININNDGVVSGELFNQFHNEINAKTGNNMIFTNYTVSPSTSGNNKIVITLNLKSNIRQNTIIIINIDKYFELNNTDPAVGGGTVVTFDNKKINDTNIPNVIINENNIEITLPTNLCKNKDDHCSDAITSTEFIIELEGNLLVNHASRNEETYTTSGYAKIINT